ncbi:sensor histidine kinase [Chitinophaga sp. NPDC101104]|uniref:sensor histidine kinase n=1 Tax=Chitinophaga sp. NPDC101104 TaxID=3390561 RepID=UPI003D07FEEA
MATHLLKEKPFRWTFLIACCVFSAVHGFILHYWLGVDGPNAWMDANIHNILLFIAVAAITQMQAYYRPVRMRYVYVAVLTTVISALWLLLTLVILRAVFPKDAVYLQWLSDTAPVRFALGWLMLMGTGFLSFIMYEMEDQRQALARKDAAEKMAREAELYKLRQQLQPHFLFNSLNSINALVSIRPEEARQMIQQLSDFLRGTLKREDQSWVPLREELQYLQLYLDIEKVRFRHRLTTELVTDPGAGEFGIPPMLLQPAVENAIKFGLYDTTEAISIRIHAWTERDVLFVSVTNPFDADMPATSRKGTGFGLNSISRRLYLLFARQDLLETSTEGNIFTTLIKVPQQHDKDHSD